MLQLEIWKVPRGYILKAAFSASGTVLEGCRNFWRWDLVGSRSSLGREGLLKVYTDPWFQLLCFVVYDDGRSLCSHSWCQEGWAPPWSVSQHTPSLNLVSNARYFDHREVKITNIKDLLIQKRLIYKYQAGSLTKDNSYSVMKTKKES